MEMGSCSTETEDITTDISENYAESTYGKVKDINTLSDQYAAYWGEWVTINLWCSLVVE